MNLIYLHYLFSKDSTQLPKKSMILVLTGLIFLFGFLSIDAQWKRYLSLHNTENNLKITFEKNELQASKIIQYQHTLLVMQKKRALILRQEPKETELTSLLKEISKLGLNLGLTFKLFAPAPEITYRNYRELPIKIRVEGTYHQFLVFLTRMAQMKPIISFSQLKIEPILKQLDNKSYSLVLNTTAKILHFRMENE